MTDLVAEIDADLTGANVTIVGSTITVTSITTGLSSTVAITDTDLFSSVTNYSSIGAATPGSGATTYAASVVVDGGAPQPISVAGAAAQTFGDLIAEINADLTGATAAIIGGNIRITSATTGGVSTIAITDTDLFSALTDYSSIATAVGGTTAISYVMDVTIDGGAPQTITVPGTSAQTFTALVNEINADLTGATASLSGGNLVITSDTTGGTSSVSIVDDDLLASLTNFDALQTAAVGTGPAFFVCHTDNNWLKLTQADVAITTLAGLEDVSLSTSTNGQVLKFNGTAWVNAADAGGLTWSSAPATETSSGSAGQIAYQQRTSGYQEVTFSVAKAGGDSTGLTNDATVYTASIVVNGSGTYPISVTGSAAQTFTTLLAEINADLTGATAALEGGNIRVTCNVTGEHTTITITDTNLFSTLTNYSSIATAVQGKDEAFYVCTATNDWLRLDKASSVPYDIAASTEGKPADGAIVLTFPVVRNFTLPANLTGSGARSAAPATATATFTLKRNGSSFGTVEFASTATTGTFSSTLTSFTPGDLFTIEAPNPQDTTLANIGITIKADLD
jgi:hypothetical protein